MNNMFTMNDTKQVFCVSEVLVHTTAVVQITYMLLESFVIWDTDLYKLNDFF